MRDPARHLAGGPDARRAIIARVAALDPLIDGAIGEDAEFRQRAAILHDATSGPFAALSGWRIAESHVVHLREDEARRRARTVAARLPSAWHDLAPVAAGLAGAADVERDLDWAGDEASSSRNDLAAARSLAALKAEGGVSRRLLADATARVALGLGAALNGLALLRDPARARDPTHPSGFVVADYLPAVVDAIRTFLSMSSANLF